MIPLLYKDHRLDGETPLRQMQLASLHLLHVLDRVCKENGLRYWLAFGTLLGAVRHKGFIPWDDDVDIFMPEDDLWKLASIAKDVFPKDVIWQDPKSFPRSDVYFGRMRDAYSMMFWSNNMPNRRENDPCGAQVDLFPLTIVRGLWGLSFLMRVKGPLEWRARHSGLIGPVSVLALIRKWILKFSYAVVSVLWGIRKMIPFGVPYYVLSNAQSTDKRLRFKVEWLDLPIGKLYEDVELNCPTDTHNVLVEMYGKDYMNPVKSHVHGEVYLPTTHGCCTGAMDYFDTVKQLRTMSQGKNS